MEHAWGNYVKYAWGQGAPVHEHHDERLELRACAIAPTHHTTTHQQTSCSRSPEMARTGWARGKAYLFLSSSSSCVIAHCGAAHTSPAVVLNLWFGPTGVHHRQLGHALPDGHEG
jgi:hypothetical protein